MKIGKRQEGYATCKLVYPQGVPSNLRGGIREVTHVFVPAQMRGQGLASKLMAKVCEEADKERKILLIMPKPFDIITLNADNLVHWYARMGFEIIQEHPILMARQVSQCLTRKTLN